MQEAYDFNIVATKVYVKDSNGKDTKKVDHIDYSMGVDRVTEYLNNFKTVELCRTYFVANAK